ncbi:MAG: nucleic acid-binding protein [Cyanobacteria bacterium J06623_5]
MSRLIVLDSGPLGFVTNPKGKQLSIACQQWLENLLRRGEKVAIPEIVDYEIRRELIRANFINSLHRLDNFKQTLESIPIETETMLLAAALWADIRKRGRPTADSKALDGDVILAAQARLLKKDFTEVIVATTNLKHLSLLTKADHWQSIS